MTTAQEVRALRTTAACSLHLFNCLGKHQIVLKLDSLCIYISMFHAYLKVFMDIKQDAVHKQHLFITKVTGFG